MKYPTTTNLNQVACTMEAKLCPDGSYVGRSGPNCVFTPCSTPTTLTTTTINNTTHGLHLTIPKTWYVMGQSGTKIDSTYATTAKSFTVGNGQYGYNVNFSTMSIAAAQKNEVDQSLGIHSVAQWSAQFEAPGSGTHYQHEQVKLGAISATKMTQIASQYDTYRYYLFANDVWFFMVSTSLDTDETKAVLQSFSF